MCVKSGRNGVVATSLPYPISTTEPNSEALAGSERADGVRLDLGYPQTRSRRNFGQSEQFSSLSFRAGLAAI